MLPSRVLPEEEPLPYGYDASRAKWGCAPPAVPRLTIVVDRGADTLTGRVTVTLITIRQDTDISETSVCSFSLIFAKDLTLAFLLTPKSIRSRAINSQDKRAGTIWLGFWGKCDFLLTLMVIQST